MKLSDVKVGDKLRADAGFTCLRDGEIVTVQEDAGGKYVPCADGKHYLDGQRADFFEGEPNDTLVGLEEVLS